MKARFGPAGNEENFAVSGHKHTKEAPKYLYEMGLTAYEYQAGHGVRLKQDTAAAIKVEAEQYGIQVSLHAPYYISLASKEEEKRENSVRYILQSAQAVDMLGGTRIVVHPGGLSGYTREEASLIAKETLQKAIRTLDEAGLSHIHICPETMGKINQLGNLEEVLDFCLLDERMIPCIDFGHLNARTLGGLHTRPAVEAVFDAIEHKLGAERLGHFHSHFSKIEFSQGGEKRHLTFADTEYGPEFQYIAELTREKGLSPVFICESRGTQAQDARTMQQLYERTEG